MHLNELCEKWLVSVKCGQQQRKQSGSGGNILQYLGWFFKIILYQAKVDHSCHPNSHLYGTVQPTKHLLIIDPLKCIVSGKSLPKPLSLPTQSECRFLFCSPGGKCSVLSGWGAPRRSPQLWGRQPGSHTPGAALRAQTSPPCCLLFNAGLLLAYCDSWCLGLTICRMGSVIVATVGLL